MGGDAQNRTGDGGFADLCLATWLRRLECALDSKIPSMRSQEFRDAMAKLAGGVVVVSARTSDGYRGLTASTLMSVSADPPLVAVGLEHGSITRSAVVETRLFNVSVLT